MKIKIFLLLLLISVFILSCSTGKDCEWPPACCKKIKKELPPGNADKFFSGNDTINSYKDDIAPIQQPESGFDFTNIYIKELKAKYSSVRPSSEFVKKHLVRKIDDFELNNEALENLTKDIESITFIDEKHGFASFSHPPTAFFAQKAQLNLEGIKGGTDIFEFEISDNNDIILKNLENVSDINSEFWDSHPFAFRTKYEGKTVDILLFASDRRNPYVKKVYLDGKIESKGESDIYYTMRVDGKWSETKMLDVSMNGISEETPYIYCLCKSPLLLFSSNRNDKTPNFIEDDKTEDFDIDSVRLKIDLSGRSINMIGEIGSLQKGKEDFFSLEETLSQDSTINTYSDERFPYVAYPYDNKAGTYIYFSSNRNDTPTIVFGSSDSVIQNKSGDYSYDIYRFPFNVPCVEQREIAIDNSLQLIVDVIDIDTRMPVEGDVSIELRNKLKNKLDSTIYKNNATFILSKNEQYSVSAKVNYKSIDTSCYGITKYYIPAKQEEFLESFQISIQDTITKRLHIAEIGQYTELGQSRTYTDEKYYYNSFKYNAIVEENERFLKQEPDIENSDYALTSLIRNRLFKVSNYLKNRSVNNYYDLSNDSINLSNFNKNNINSEKSINNGLFTYNINTTTLLRDTIFVKMHEDTTHCIDLRVDMVNKENYREGINGNKSFRLFQVVGDNLYKELTDSTFLIEKQMDYVIFRLKYGLNYLVMGGSDYVLDNPCVRNSPRKQLEYYCIYENNGINSLGKRAPKDSVLSKISRTQNFIATSRFKPEETIFDTIFLYPSYFEKPRCKYEFTQIQSEYHRRVPYFQTAYWEVNTSENLRRDLLLLNKSNSLYNKPFPPSELNLIEPSETWSPWWYGAKWIELHKANTYWANNDPKAGNRRTFRINQYISFAKSVDFNIKQMKEIIGNELLNVYEIIAKTDTCTDCGDRKFIIEIEAWSDYRPVYRGWYLSKNKSEDTIKYAECQDIENFNSAETNNKTFTPVVVTNGDYLGGYNSNLSKLRAFFGFKEIVKQLCLNNNFKKYSDDEILTPDELVDNQGKLLSMEAIDSLIKNSKIIVITKGYDTDPNTPSSSNQPAFSDANNKVDIAKYKKIKGISTYYNLDTVRTLFVVVRQMKYYKGRMIADSCCVDY